MPQKENRQQPESVERDLGLPLQFIDGWVCAYCSKKLDYGQIEQHMSGYHRISRGRITLDDRGIFAVSTIPAGRIELTAYQLVQKHLDREPRRIFMQSELEEITGKDQASVSRAIKELVREAYAETVNINDGKRHMKGVRKRLVEDASIVLKSRKSADMQQ